MSIIVPTSYTDLLGVAIRPGAPIVDGDWETISQNLHHLYARGSERLPVFWDDDPIETTSTTYVQPAPMDSLTAVWRPTRLADSSFYRLTFLIYGKDCDVRVTAYDATVGGGGSLATTEVSCGATAEWGTDDGRYAVADVIDSGEPIPIAFSFEVKATTTAAEVYQVAIVSQILTNTTLP